MNSTSILTFGILLGTVVGAVLVCWTRLLPRLKAMASEGRENVYSAVATPMECYGPMLRLLERDDLRFLVSQPGVTPELVARFRHRHYLVFQCYLEALRTDFRLTVRSLIVLMLDEQTDRPDLAHLLVRSQILFSSRLLLLRWRLVLYRMGMATVNPASLIDVFAGVKSHLQTPVSDPQPGKA